MLEQPNSPDLESGRNIDAEQVDFSSVAWERSDESFRKSVVGGRRMTVTRYVFEPGGEFPLHRHEQEQITYVIKGEFRFTIGDIEHRLSSDSIIVVPASVAHKGHAGPSGAEILCVVAPPRVTDDAIEVLEEG